MQTHDEGGGLSWSIELDDEKLVETDDGERKDLHGETTMARSQCGEGRRGGAVCEFQYEYDWWNVDEKGSTNAEQDHSISSCGQLLKSFKWRNRRHDECEVLFTDDGRAWLVDNSSQRGKAKRR